MSNKISICIFVAFIFLPPSKNHQSAMRDCLYDVVYDRARPIGEKFEDVRLDMFTFPEVPNSQANLTLYQGEVQIEVEDALPYRMFREKFDLSWNCSKDHLYTMFFTNLESNRTFWIYKQYQHWLIVDIRNCNITNGTELIPYQQVAGQMDRRYHLYTVYIFQQRGPLNLTLFYKQPYNMRTLRKTIEIKSFVYQHKMIGPVSGTFFYQSM